MLIYYVLYIAENYYVSKIYIVNYCYLYCQWLEASGTDYNWYVYCIIYKMLSLYTIVPYFKNNMFILRDFFQLTIF